MTEFQTAAAAMLPNLLRAEAHLRSLAAPQASKLSERIGTLLDELAELGEDVAMYYARWPGHGDMPATVALSELSATTAKYR